MTMSTRLQVLLDDEGLNELKERPPGECDGARLAAARSTARNARKARGESKEKLEMIRRYAQYAFASGDHEDIAAAIESGYRTKGEP